MMKLSSRERILISILCTLVFSLVFYKFIYVPKEKRIEDMSILEQEYRDKVALVQKGSEVMEGVLTEYKINNAKISAKTQRFYPSIEQEKIIVILEDMFNKSNVKMGSIAFSEIASSDINTPGFFKGDNVISLPQIIIDNFNKALEQEKKIAEGTDSSSIMDPNSITSSYSMELTPPEKEDVEEEPKVLSENMTVQLALTGTYNNITSFMEMIENNPHIIVIDDFSMNAQEDGTIEAELSLTFYAVPKMHSQDEDYYLWDIVKGDGKDNPFGTVTGISSGTASKGSSEKKETVSNDFIMSVKPISSDLPTVAISGSSLGDRSYIFADNKGLDSVELIFDKIEGNYAVKYRTSYMSYPEVYTEWAYFTPYGKQIQMAVYSNPRNSTADVSGVQMTIVNNTDLNLNISVMNEDKALPRFRVVDKIGKISVTNK